MSVFSLQARVLTFSSCQYFYFIFYFQLLANENRQPCEEANGVIERRLSGAEQNMQAAVQMAAQSQAKSTPKSERRFSNPVTSQGLLRKA